MPGAGVRRSARRRALAGLAVVALVLPLAACTDDGGTPTPPPKSNGGNQVARLTFGAFGTDAEIGAYTAVTDAFNASRDDADVRLQAAPDEATLRERIEAGSVPDVFMVSRDDLAWLLEEELTQPVDALLDDRGVDFGDQYSRDGLQAFSADNRLQCMPYGISPMVMFYNRDLVDFERMEARGLPVPTDSLSDERNVAQSRSFEEFAAAAQFAAKPRRQTRGVYVEPTLEALAPFVYSGGGPLYDDPVDPTSLAFSDDTTRTALEVTLELLRDPLVTPSDAQLAQRTPLQMFERGQLAMIEGYRSLVPKLREVQGLDFDVIAMPEIEQDGTVGQVTGLCLSSKAAYTAIGADFMVHMLSSDSVRRVTQAGYLVPANLEVALSEDFLQPGRLPEHSGTFNAGVRNITFPPLLTNGAELDEVVADDLRRLLNQPVIDDLGLLLEQIDEESRTVLDPESVEESESPSEDPSDDPSESGE